MIVMKNYPHVLCCSAAFRMDVYIVGRLFEYMLTNGSGRTADVLYAEVLFCILRMYPLQPGRGTIICKHRKKVYIKKMFQV